MNLQLEDKVVWVTGASGGIGRSIATHMLDEGARVALHGNRSADAMRAWIDGQDYGERAFAVEADVRDGDALRRNAEEIRERWGRIDVCVANAGLWPSEDRSIDQLADARLTDTITVNLVGAMLTAGAFLKTLRETGPRDDGHGAALTFIGSTAGRYGERGHADYAASKAGLVGAMLSIKNEITHIDPFARANVVEPGWTVTHMAKPALDVPGTIEHVTRTMAVRQLGRAADIARTVVWLSSPFAARHVSGQVVTVAGGMEGRSLWGDGDVDAAAVRARLDEE